MSVSSSTSTISYAGNGSTSTAYTVPFNFYDASDLKVYSVDASGTSTLLTITTNYTVSGGGGSTGSVTTTAAIPSTNTVLINRTVPYTQLTSFTTGDRLPANSIETALDKLTMETQQLSRNTLPDTSATTGSAPYVLGVGVAGGTPSWIPQSSSGIADGAITTTKIANGAITTAKLSTGGPAWDANGNLTTSGNVGIGTSSPVVKLHVNGPSNTNSAILVSNQNTNIAILSNEASWLGSGTSNNAVVSSYGSNALLLATSGSEKVRIDNNGNVGIGTSAPAAKLHVNAGNLNVTNNGDTTAYIQNLGGGNLASLALVNNNTSGRSWSINAWGSAGLGGLYFTDNTANAQRLSIAADGTINAQTNPITNCPTTAKAWVSFDGTTAGTFAGGASTVSRTAGSTSATITTTSAHGLITGQYVYALSGVAAGTYQITVLTTTTFTITTIATTVLSSVAITFQVSSIRSQYNVSSVTKHGTGDYTVNFTTALADTNYALSGAGTVTSRSGNFCQTSVNYHRTTSPSTTNVRIEVMIDGGGANPINADPTIVAIQIFGN